MSKKAIIIGVLSVAAIVGVLLALIPMEKKQQMYEKYGKLAVNAETDEKSKYILDNVDLYPEVILDMYYRDYENNLDYVYNYPTHKDDYKNMSFTSEELNSESVPALYMDDPRWGYEKLGDSYIKSWGCVPVSITMSYLYLTGNDDVDPVKLGNKAVEIDALGYWGGISNEHFVELAETTGLKAKEYDYSAEDATADLEVIKSALENNHAVILGMVGDTFGGHAIVVRACDDNGTIYINDPGDREYTQKPWTFDELSPEIYFIWELSTAE